MTTSAGDQEGEDYMPRPGEKILVPTNVTAGAFPGERLVTIETSTGPISGFTKTDAIVNRGGDQYLIAEVKTVSSSTSTSIVKLPGSFFTTTGLVSIPTARLVKAAG
jgi:hypothetical protein